MSVELPSWQPFADDADVPIPSGPEPGRVVALLAPRSDTGESWAAGLAFDLATRWADDGRKIVLVDAALEHPTLHLHVGLPNQEGLTDAARFGASVARIARPVPGRSFFLVTAGSPAGDGAQVAESARWRRLVAGFGEAGVTLVLFLREGGAGLDAFLASAADVVVLATPGDAPPAVPNEARARVRAVIGPDVGAGDSASTSQGASSHGPIATEEAVRDASGEPDVLAHGPASAARTPPGGNAEGENAGQAAYGAARGAARDPLEDLIGDDAPSADDFSAADFADPAGADRADDVAPFAAKRDSGYATAGAGTRKREGSDPDARRKLLWVALVVLALVVLILVGVLRPG